MTFVSATTDAQLRRVPLRVDGLLRFLLLACTFGLLITLLAPAPAQAHAMHQEVIAVGIPGSADGGTPAEVGECATTCCPATCAAALVVYAHPQLRAHSGTSRYAPAADSRVEGFRQATLRRPPKA